MLYYKLWFDDNGEEILYWCVNIDEKRLEQAGGDIWAYSRCQVCPNAMPVPCRISYPGPEADYDRDALTTVPIVSDRVARLLTDVCPDEVQLIPAQIDAPGAWWIANVLPLTDAIDYAKSVIMFHEPDHPRFPGKPAAATRLIVRADVPLPHIFRVKDLKVSIVVSELIRKRCQEEKMTDMKFIPATMVDWFDYWNDTQSERWCYRPPWAKKNGKHGRRG